LFARTNEPHTSGAFRITNRNGFRLIIETLGEEEGLNLTSGGKAKSGVLESEVTCGKGGEGGGGQPDVIRMKSLIKRRRKVVSLSAQEAPRSTGESQVMSQWDWEKK